MLFKLGDIKNNIHIFNCPHCNKMVELLKNNEYLATGTGHCPYCDEWVIYNFNDKTVKILSK